MSARMDHARVAQENLDVVGSTPMLPEVAAVTATAALVHATLALVEQQRIANVIAVGEQFDWVGAPDAWQQERVLRADVREALGL